MAAAAGPQRAGERSREPEPFVEPRRDRVQDVRQGVEVHGRPLGAAHDLGGRRRRAEREPRVARHRAGSISGRQSRRVEGRCPLSAPTRRQRAICRASPQSTIRPRTVAAQSSGNRCSSSTTGANRSPRSSTRSSTSAGLEHERVRIGGLELVPGERRRDRRPLAGAQRVDRTPSSCARRSGSSRSAPCPCGAPSSGSTRSASDARPRGAARAPARAAWCRGRSPRRRRSAARTPGCPWSRTSSGSTRGRCGRARRAGSARPRSTPRCPAGGPGSRSNAISVGRSTSGTFDSDGCSSRSARFASQTSVGRSSQMQKWIVLLLSSTGSLRTQSGRCEGHCFS